MKTLFILFFLLLSGSTFAQNYQADYKASFEDIEANQDFTVYLQFAATELSEEAVEKNQGEIRVKTLLFLETGILFKGVVHTASSPDLIRSSGDLVFIPYANIINAGMNGASDFVLVIKN